MKKTIIIIIVVGALVAVLTLLCSGGCFSDGTQEVVSKEGEEIKTAKTLRTFGEMPAFTFLDYNGNSVNSEDFKGKILVVNSWAVWCPFCLKELDDFTKLQEEYKDNVVVIAIDRAESLEKAKGFTDSIGISDDLVFLMDPRDSFYKSIGGFSMPETIFVDTNGEIRVHKRGPMELSEMKKNVEQIIGLN